MILFTPSTKFHCDNTYLTTVASFRFHQNRLSIYLPCLSAIVSLNINNFSTKLVRHCWSSGIMSASGRGHLGSIPVIDMYFSIVLSQSSSPSVRYGTFYLKYTSFYFLRTTFLRTRASDFSRLRTF